MAIATSALLRGGRLLDPEKITSSMDEARMDLYEDSPITQRSASTRFDFPQPFGPTTPVRPGSIMKSVGSTNDLKPSRRSRVSFMLCGLIPQGGVRTFFPLGFPLNDSLGRAGTWPRLSWRCTASGRRMNRRAREGNCRPRTGPGFPDLFRNRRKNFLWNRR